MSFCCDKIRFVIAKKRVSKELVIQANVFYYDTRLVLTSVVIWKTSDSDRLYMPYLLTQAYC